MLNFYNNMNLLDGVNYSDNLINLNGNDIEFFSI